MPKFKFSFARDYTIREGFDRIIEAPSLAEAEAAAANLAVEYNRGCPDDCSESGGGGATDFETECKSAEVHKASDPDYCVLPDGQCVPYEA